MDKRILALLAATIATSIFGFNHTIAKELMPNVLSPNALLYCRVLGAAICFWVVSLFLKSEKVDFKDQYIPEFSTVVSTIFIATVAATTPVIIQLIKPLIKQVVTKLTKKKDKVE